jgi:hypothetical protein
MDAPDGPPGVGHRLAEILDAARAHDEPHVEVFALDALTRLTAGRGDVDTACALETEADRRMASADHFITERDRTDVAFARHGRSLGRRTPDNGVHL